MAATSFSPNSEGRGSLIIAFAQLFRLPVAILAALAGCATLYSLDSTAPLWQYGLTGIVLSCMYGAACAINDYWDLEKDRVDHPERPLPAGNLSPQQAYWGAIVLFGMALVAAIPLGLDPWLLVAINTVLLWNYSYLLFYSGVLGNGVVATIVAALIFLGSLVAQRPLAMLYPTSFLFFYTLAKEIIWDVHDVEGDRQQGIMTIANRWGSKLAFFIAWGLIVLLLVSIPISLLLMQMVHPFVFATFSVVMLVSLAIGLIAFQQQQSDEAYQEFVRLERLSMLLGIIGLLGAAPPA